MTTREKLTKYAEGMFEKNGIELLNMTYENGVLSGYYPKSRTTYILAPKYINVEVIEVDV